MRRLSQHIPGRPVVEATATSELFEGVSDYEKDSAFDVGNDDG